MNLIKFDVVIISFLILNIVLLIQKFCLTISSLYLIFTRLTINLKKMKHFLPLLFAVFALLLFTGCPKEDTTVDNPVELSIYTNPTDGTIFSIDMEDGRTITYFGDKDSEGMPTNLKSVTVNYGDGDGDYIIDMENTTIPKSVMAPNGSVFELDWISETSVRIKAISPDGTVQASVPFSTTTSYSSINNVSDNPPNIRQGVDAIAKVREINDEPVTIAKNGGNMSFNIVQCDAAVKNAYVVMSTEPAIGSGDYVASGDGAGNYDAKVPQAGQPEADYEKECDEIGEIVNNVCLAYAGVKMFGLENNISTIAKLLSDNIPADLVNSPQGQMLLGKVDKALPAIDAICEFNDKTNIGDLCKLSHLLYEEPQQTSYKFTLTITIPGQGTFETESASFDPGQPSAWDIDLGGSFSVQNLHTVPGDPSPSQGYVAYAYVYCPDPDGTLVTISMVGTDGYSKSDSFDISTSSEVSLSVPGASEGVVDVITVDANGKQWQISIVF